jgi:hypothetical protein
LSVLDNRPASAAAWSLFAGRLIRHLKVEIKLAVELDGNVHLSDGELLDLGVGTAAEWRRLGLVAVGWTSDTLGVGESTLGQRVTLSEGVGATPSVEVHSSIASNRLAWVERGPVETGVLLRNTVVVCVRWARE